MKLKIIRNIELGEFIVMPNHIHDIIILNEKVSNQTADEIYPDNQTANSNNPDDLIIDWMDGASDVETRHALSLDK